MTRQRKPLKVGIGGLGGFQGRLAESKRRIHLGFFNHTCLASNLKEVARFRNSLSFTNSVAVP
jgi:hypothetical protein